MSVRNDSKRSVGMARSLRKRMSPPEAALWRRLRREVTGFRFRRQYPAGRHVLDFYCPRARVCVEVDGWMHESKTERDAERDAWLETNGILVLRFSAQSLGGNGIDRAVWTIWRVCCERTGVDWNV